MTNTGSGTTGWSARGPGLGVGLVTPVSATLVGDATAWEALGVCTSVAGYVLPPPWTLRLSRVSPSLNVDVDELSLRK